MKNLIIILLILANINTFSQEYYYSDNRKIKIIRSNKKILIKLNKPNDYDNEKNTITMQIKQIDATLEIEERGTMDSLLGTVIINITEEKNDIEISSILSELSKNENFISVKPFFGSPAGGFRGYTNTFFTKPKLTTSQKNIEILMQKTHSYFAEEESYNPEILPFKTEIGYDALYAANTFYESGLFEFSLPLFIFITMPQCGTDPYFDRQWALKNTGQNGGTAGADINICEAWKITRGNSDIIVAVIGSGVDLDHPDFEDINGISNVLEGFDATGGGGNGDADDYAHETACAGIIGANGENGIGISGIAYGCTILPIQTGMTEKSKFIFTNKSGAVGIRLARQNGADVMSNSWVIPDGLPDDMVELEIVEAVTQGRSGLGCIIICGSGNIRSSSGQESLYYPAKYSQTISVGAMSMCNERKKADFTWPYNNMSCDDEEWWGSCYGTGLDLVAPGVKIYTTDISGDGGYNDGDYKENFNGTSAATPHVAGIAALMLSVNPCLTWQEVKDILSLSCDRVGGYPYCYHEGKISAWNEEMGYGRINAYKAVKSALSTENYYHTSNYTLDVASVFDNEEPIVFFDGCFNLGYGTYIRLKKYKLHVSITYPYVENPGFRTATNGLSPYSPNMGTPWMGIVNYNSTSAVFDTYAYQLKTLSGEVFMLPGTSEDMRFNFTIFNKRYDIQENHHFSGNTFTGNKIYYAVNNITTKHPVIVKSDANITFIAGNKIILEPGFETEEGAEFEASVGLEDLFSCITDKVITEELLSFYDFSKFKSEMKDTIPEITECYIKNFPNPFVNSITFEFYINESKNVSLIITDMNGMLVSYLINKKKMKAGIYQISFDDISIPAGFYFCTIETDDFTETKKIIKIE